MTLAQGGFFWPATGKRSPLGPGELPKSPRLLLTLHYPGVHFRTHSLCFAHSSFEESVVGWETQEGLCKHGAKAFILAVEGDPPDVWS